MKRKLFHEALKPLAWLKGTWRMENEGSDEYQSMIDENNTYVEEMSFGFPYSKQPVFYFTETSLYDSHWYHNLSVLKVIPGTNRIFISRDPYFENCEIINGTNLRITRNTMHIFRNRMIRDPEVPFYVRERQKEFKFDDNRLEFVEYVQTYNTFEPKERIRAKYVKVREEVVVRAE